MTGMPFTMAKGFYESVFSRTLNELPVLDLVGLALNLDDRSKPSSAWGLLAGNPLFPTIYQDWHGTPMPSSAPKEGEVHFVDHWFASHEVTASGTTRLLTPTEVRHWVGAGTPKPLATTGWWHDWRGDAEEIVRVAMLRSILASLGAPDPGSLPKVGKAAPKNGGSGGGRRWPVDFRWLCGGHRFEFWIEWRERQGTGAGESRTVQATLLTPGPGAPSEPLASDWAQLPKIDFHAVTPPVRYDPTDPIPGFSTSIPPVDSQGPRGIVVVGHARNEITYRKSFTPSASGKWFSWEFGAAPHAHHLAIHGSTGQPGASPNDVVESWPSADEGGIK